MAVIIRTLIILALVLATSWPTAAAADDGAVRQIIAEESAQFGVSAELVTCIDLAESGLNPDAVSPTNDYQVPQWHRWPDGRFYSFEQWADPGASVLNTRDAIRAQVKAIRAGYIRMWVGSWGCLP